MCLVVKENSYQIFVKVLVVWDIAVFQIADLKESRGGKNGIVQKTWMQMNKYLKLALLQ